MNIIVYQALPTDELRSFKEHNITLRQVIQMTFILLSR